MLDRRLKDRFDKLFEVRLCERRKQFPLELGELTRQFIATGSVTSGNYVLAVLRAHESELEVRSILAWNSLVRVHRTFGGPASEMLREDLKHEIHERITLCFDDLGASLTSATKKSGMKMTVSLDQARLDVIKKHDIEIDIYADSLSSDKLYQGATIVNQNYQFYGDVASVQTGANSVANVVQNLGPDDQASLKAALEAVREAISVAPTFGDTKRRELLEIADECTSEMAAKRPNNTKLLTIFNVLGTAIQTVASAQPAYQALKLALIPLGISLP